MAAHSLRRFTQHPENADKVILKIDFKNAFNSLRRDAMLRQVALDTPAIYAYVYQTYANPSHLFFGDELLNSKEGVQQGDPLGPFLYSITVMNLLRGCESELNLWYLDDANLAGDPSIVLADFSRILENGKSFGEMVNPSKSELTFLGDVSRPTVEAFTSLAPNISLTAMEHLTLLGSPIGPCAAAQVLTAKLNALKLMTERLEHIESHDALFLLKNCFALPKLTFFFEKHRAF